MYVYIVQLGICFCDKVWFSVIISVYFSLGCIKSYGKYYCINEVMVYIGRFWWVMQL